MNSENSAVIIGGARTPQTRINGTLLQTTTLGLSTLVAREAVVRSSVNPERIDSVVWGVMYQTEGNSVHLAKHTAMHAGLRSTVPAMLCGRLCCSGLQAVVDAARLISVNEHEFVLAGSVDCVSRISALCLKPKRKLQTACSEEDPIGASTLDENTGKRMAELVEAFARESNIERSAMDDFAFASRERTKFAQEKGLFLSEIVAVPPAISQCESPAAKAINQDQLEARWPTRTSLTHLDSPYGQDGRVTRGNTSAFADGAAALVLTNRALARENGCKPLAAIRSWAVSAADAHQIGEALVSSIIQALRRGGVTLKDVDWFECEEAFAANCIYAATSLALPAEKINPRGGALALGHPPATSGIRQLLCAAHGLQQTQKQFALIAVAAGGSQAISVLIEHA